MPQLQIFNIANEPFNAIPENKTGSFHNDTKICHSVEFYRFKCLLFYHSQRLGIVINSLTSKSCFRMLKGLQVYSRIQKPGGGF